MLHLCVTTLMVNGPGFGFSWVKCNMVLSDAKYTDIGVPLFFVPRIYMFKEYMICISKYSNKMSFITSISTDLELAKKEENKTTTTATQA